MDVLTFIKKAQGAGIGKVATANTQPQNINPQGIPPYLQNPQSNPLAYNPLTPKNQFTFYNQNSTTNKPTDESGKILNSIYSKYPAFKNMGDVH